MKKVAILSMVVICTNLLAQEVTTFAGSGSRGSTDGTGTAASFNYPRAVAVDGSGNVYVADNKGHLIRKITSAGVVTTFAGSGNSLIEYNRGSTDGTGAAASFNFPSGVAVDGSGNVYVADSYNDKIRKITPAAVVTTFAGSGSEGSADGTGTAATFTGPSDVAVDGSGNVYVADAGNDLIRKITSAGVVTTLAGSGSAGSADGTGTAASFDGPSGVAVDGSGNVYVADAGNNLIRKITSAGVVTTLAGRTSRGSTDGTGTAASFWSPRGVAVDGSGNVYVGDYTNSLIRKITSAGVVTTLAGSVLTVGSADGTGKAALFNYPSGVALDGSGNLYVADSYNHEIRKVTILTTFKVPSQYSTIQAAIDAASNGDTVLVADGLYKENLIIDSKKIMLMGESRDKTIIDGQNLESVIYYTGSTLYGNNDIWQPLRPIEIKNFTIQNGKGPTGKRFGGGIELEQRSRYVLDNLIVQNNEGGGTGPAGGGGGISIYTGTQDTLVVKRTIFRNNKQGLSEFGALMNGWDNWIFAESCLFYNNDIALGGGNGSKTSTMLYSSTVANNDKIASGNFGVLHFYNSIIYHNKDTKILDYLQSDVEYQVHKSSVEEDLKGYDTAPMFVKSKVEGTEEPDFHLMDSSPLIGAGDDDFGWIEMGGLILYINTDVEGNPRINPTGSNPDMGAFENKWGTPQNAPPVIAIQSDLTIAEDGTSTATLTATDADGEAITYSAVSDTNAVTVSVSSTTLTLTPNANWHGVATITAYASDGTSKDSTTFKLTVTPVQDAPTAFDWVSSALDTINITQSNLADTYTLQWDASIDVDGDSINYLIYAKIGLYPTEEVEEITDTAFQLIYEEILENVFEGRPVNGATVSLNVKATDGIDTVDVTGENRVIYVNRYEYLSTEGEGVPVEFALHENYPNPFNPTTTLRFDLPEVSDLTLTIYNMLGQKVRTFNMQSTPAGYHSITWDATNDLNQQVGAGVYLYQLQTKDFVKTRKMVLLK
jgi:hypothetical protein